MSKEWLPEFSHSVNVTDAKTAVFQIDFHGFFSQFIQSMLNECGLSPTTEPVGPNATARYYTLKREAKGGGGGEQSQSFQSHGFFSGKLRECSNPLLSINTTIPNFLDTAFQCMKEFMKNSYIEGCEPKHHTKDHKLANETLMWWGIATAICLLAILSCYLLSKKYARHQDKSCEEGLPLTPRTK